LITAILSGFLQNGLEIKMDVDALSLEEQGQDTFAFSISKSIFKI